MRKPAITTSDGDVGSKGGVCRDDQATNNVHLDWYCRRVDEACERSSFVITSSEYPSSLNRSFPKTSDTGSLVLGVDSGISNAVELEAGETLEPLPPEWRQQIE